MTDLANDDVLARDVAGMDRAFADFGWDLVGGLGLITGVIGLVVEGSGIVVFAVGVIVAYLRFCAVIRASGRRRG